MAEKEKEKEEKAKEGKAEEGKGKAAPIMGMLIVIIIGFLVMIVTPAITYFVIKKTLPPPVKAGYDIAEANEEEENVLHLDPVLVNIQGTGFTRKVQAEVYIVLSEARLKEKLALEKPMLTDKVATTLCRRTVAELEGQKGRESLKRDIMDEINEAIKGKWSGVVTKVYLTKFLVQ